MKKTPDKLSFVGHLEELRTRLLCIVISVIATTCLMYAFIDGVFAVIIKPVGKLVFTAPADAFLAQIALAFYCGILLALPVILYQIWSFIAVGLRKSERVYVYIFGPCSLLLFFIGGLFAYFVTVPISIKFLLKFSSDLMVPMITVKSYISFMGTLILAFGIVFELPLVLVFLTKIGIATPDFLVEKRRYAVVMILILSAIMTPPDFITQLIMAGPLIFLYEIGIIASKIAYRQK